MLKKFGQIKVNTYKPPKIMKKESTGTLKIVDDILNYTEDRLDDADDLIYEDIIYQMPDEEDKKTVEVEVKIDSNSAVVSSDAHLELNAKLHDTKEAIFFNLSTFTIRCSLAKLPTDGISKEQFLKSLWLKNLVYENPGSYPSLFNQIDAHSWREYYYTQGKVFAHEFRTFEIKSICSFLTLRDVL